MQIILLQDIEGLGGQYETVNVKNGYGRNYLIPKKLAMIANKDNSAVAASKLEELRAAEARIIQNIEDMMEKIKAQPLTIGAKVGTTDKIFGSVNNVQLAEAIKRQTGVEVDRRKIVLHEEVKTLGTYSASIRFREGVKYDFDFEVVSE